MSKNSAHENSGSNFDPLFAKFILSTRGMSSPGLLTQEPEKKAPDLLTLDGHPAKQIRRRKFQPTHKTGWYRCLPPFTQGWQSMTEFIKRRRWSVELIRTTKIRGERLDIDGAWKGLSDSQKIELLHRQVNGIEHRGAKWD